MLGNIDARATLAVADLERARRFYAGTLGLRQVFEMGEAIGYKAGGSTLLVYRSQFAGTNQATAATWDCGADTAAVVAGLVDAGVTFERYDMPDVRHEGALHVFGDFKTAWFKDPDGNILALAGR